MTLTDRAWLRGKRILDRYRIGARIDFDLQIGLHGRYSAYLLWALTTHHTVRVRDHEANLLRHMLPLGNWLLHTVLDRATPNARFAKLKILVETAASGMSVNRVATLDDDWFRPIDPAREMRVPYFMHPSVYRHTLMRELPWLRTRPSKILLGFAGSIGPTYRRVSNFGILSRPEVLDAVKSTFGSRSFAVTEAATQPPESHCRAFAHSITDLPGDTVDKHLLDSHAYLTFVADCDFFLCPPGWTMPNTHNAIEAMSVGTIPVLNYADYFDPPLRDGVDCVAFSDLQDLLRLPARLDALSPDHRASMRQAVLAYYSRYLDGGAFANALLAHPARNLRLLYNSEGGSVAKLEARTGRDPS